MTEPTPGLAAALADLQAKLPKIGKTERAKVATKDGGSYSYTYAGLASISDKILPLLSKHGLSFTAFPTLNGAGAFVLRYTLRHVSGGSETGEYPLGGNTPQAIGSAITYGRRYCLCAVVGLAPEDDDDGAAAEAEAQARRASQPRQTRQRQADRPSAYQRGSSADKPAGADLLVKPNQLAALHIKLQAFGIGRDQRDAGLAYMADVIGHELESSKKLTESEFRAVMDQLDADLARGTDVTPPAAEPPLDDPTTDPEYQP